MARTKIDRRILKTKRAIAIALMQLLAEKPLEDITITELTLKADINRKTFYLHYSSIEDVAAELVAKAGELFSAALEASLTDGRVFIPAKFFECIHEKVSEQNELFRAFCAENTSLFFLHAMGEKCIADLIVVYRNYTDMSDTALRLSLQYMFHGALNLYMDWVRNPSSMPLTEVTALAVRLVERDTAMIVGKD
jgi:AcrR family transcriptional regulator